jgi:hypothetical protein
MQANEIQLNSEAKKPPDKSGPCLATLLLSAVAGEEVASPGGYRLNSVAIRADKYDFKSILVGYEHDGQPGMSIALFPCGRTTQWFSCSYVEYTRETSRLSRELDSVKRKVYATNYAIGVLLEEKKIQIRNSQLFYSDGFPRSELARLLDICPQYAHSPDMRSKIAIEERMSEISLNTYKDINLLFRLALEMADSSPLWKIPIPAIAGKGVDEVCALLKACIKPPPPVRITKEVLVKVVDNIDAFIESATVDKRVAEAALSKLLGSRDKPVEETPGIAPSDHTYGRRLQTLFANAGYGVPPPRDNYLERGCQVFRDKNPYLTLEQLEAHFYAPIATAEIKSTLPASSEPPDGDTNDEFNQQLICWWLNPPEKPPFGDFPELGSQSPAWVLGLSPTSPPPEGGDGRSTEPP